MQEEHFESLYPEDARFYEINKLFGYIKEGYSCQLLGLPGSGRSDLLDLIAYNKRIRDKHLGNTQQNMLFVVVDFSEIRKRPLFDVMKFLFLNLADSLREQGLTEEYKAVNDSFREALSFHDELVLFQEFKQVVDFLALEKKLTLVFLFSRFEDYIPSVTNEFFANLRTLRNRAKYRFSVIFSVHRPLEVLLDPMLLSDFYEFVAGRLVYMQFHDESTTNFWISYLGELTGKNISKATRGEITRLTGGYGRLMKLAIETFLGPTDAKGNIEELLLSQTPIQVALTKIWLEFTPAEQSDILHNTFEDPMVDWYLEDCGLVKDKKIQIPLFESFVKASQTIAHVEAEKITYDENTDTIRKGKLVLSDNLTSAEFRLLRYLWQNQERVVERDEIISIVWSNVKSKAGITDQAVDQLIFRLRRKIEEDPNKPLYLQTVKGRGFRFIS